MADTHSRKADKPPIQVAYDADAERNGAPPLRGEGGPGGASGAPTMMADGEPAVAEGARDTDGVHGQARHGADEAPSDLGQGIGLEEWTPPFYLRYRLPIIGGVVLSAAWLAASITFIAQHIGWRDLLLLLPHEVGGMAAGMLTPLALLWMVIAFFERGRRLRHDTEALGRNLHRLAYPSAGAQTRVNEITEALRRQARELTPASEEAAARAGVAQREGFIR